MRIGIKLGFKKKLLCILFTNLKYSTDVAFLRIDDNFQDYCSHNFLFIISQIEKMSIFKMKLEQKCSFLKNWLYKFFLFSDMLYMYPLHDIICDF